MVIYKCKLHWICCKWRYIVTDQILPPLSPALSNTDTTKRTSIDIDIDMDIEITTTEAPLPKKSTMSGGDIELSVESI